MEKTQLTTIAIDAMGGDFGPTVTVPSTITFLREANKRSAHKAILVGMEERLLELVGQHGGESLMQDGYLSVTAASQIVEMHEPPALALKKKKDSSMRVAINLVKEGVAQACVSAGNTGALMATARFVLKTIPGISRPAIITRMPCKDTRTTVHMLDLGANVDSSPEMLVQFATMGSVITSRS